MQDSTTELVCDSSQQHPSLPFQNSESIDYGGSLLTPRRRARVNPRLLDTPVAKTSNSAKDALLEQNAEARQERLAAECKTWCVGPMPIQQFLQKVLPNYKLAESATRGKSFFKSVPILKNNESETLLYEPLVCASLHVPPQPRPAQILTDTFKCNEFNMLMSKFQLVDTHNHSETTGLGSLRPDLLLYGKDVVNKYMVRIGVYRSNFGCTEFFVEVKKDGSCDPLCDPKTEGEAEEGGFFRIYKGIKSGDTDVETIGQIVSYATELCARQHRTHCFSISIYGSYARIFRWDRSGVIVSTAFNYQKTPWLSIFARQYDLAGNADRGHDLTIERAPSYEEARFVEVITEHIKNQLCPDAEDIPALVDMHYEQKKVYRIPLRPQIEETHLIQHEESCASEPPHKASEPRNEAEGRMNKQSCSRKYKDTQYFLVSRPVAAPLSSAGRGTRGYWSVKIPDTSIGETEYQIAFLKDTWRIAAHGVEKEGDIILQLLEAGVPHISDIFGQGDVAHENEDVSANQKTMTDEYQPASWNCNKDNSSFIAPHIHYRMAMTEVGYPLKHLLGTKELIHATLTAFEAAWEAFERCNRLHRDISINNIILVKKNGEWRIGYLIDWDLSCKSNDNALPRNYRRSASWAFMAINTLRGKSKFKHTFRDDMESFFYVVVYASLRWLPHTFTGDLAKEMRTFFDDCFERQGMIVGGTYKMQNLVDGCFIEGFEWKNPELAHWIESALTLQREDINNKGPLIWTPKNLHRLWVETDNSILHTKDRFEHIVIVNNVVVKDLPVPATVTLVARTRSESPEAPQAINSVQTAPARTRARITTRPFEQETTPKKRRVQVKAGPRRQSKRQRGLEP